MSNSDVVSTRQKRAVIADSRDSFNHSVAGEEDPGAALELSARCGLAHFSQTVEVTLKVINSPGQMDSALSQWANEGSTTAQPPPATMVNEYLPSPPLTNAEVVQLRIRMIALENIVISLLTEAPAHQLKLVREMASFIAPRQGCTAHPTTLRAAAEMLNLVDRAIRFSPL